MSGEEQEPLEAYDFDKDIPLRLKLLEARATKLEKEVETMSYVVVALMLLTFLLVRRLAFEEEPKLESHE